MKLLSDASKQTRKFVCHKCGSVFEADFSDTKQVTNCLPIEVECPVCQTRIHWTNGEEVTAQNGIVEEVE